MEFMACINCEYPVQQLLYHKLKATTNTSNFASQYPRKRLEKTNFDYILYNQILLCSRVTYLDRALHYWELE